jgi:chaperone required for assembly of F1-ATPase
LPPRPDPSDRRKRFYALADVAPAEGGFAVTLDGRTPRSPERRPLVLQTRALAELVAAEWAAQGVEIVPAAMPATRLAWTAIAFAAGEGRGAAAARLGEFAGSDLLCYFAETPAALVARQEHEWSPIIDWAERSLGVAFQRTRGIVHQPQAGATIRRIEALAAEEDPFTLAALATAAPLFGSVILAFALRHSELTAEAAFALSRLDETFQEERWGVDEEAAARVAAMGAEAAMLERWFAALRQ